MAPLTDVGSGAQASSSRRLGVVAPLPPRRTGVAGYALAQAESLADLTPVTLFSDLVDGAGPDTDLEIRPIEDLASAVADGEIDDAIYHVGNSVENFGAVRAAAVGPPGIVMLHDGTIHHLLVAVAGAQPRGGEAAYDEYLRLAHGDSGADIAAAHRSGSSGDIEMALFDGLAPILARHRLVIVHSRWLAALVRRRVPAVPVAVVPLPAPGAVEMPSADDIAAFRADHGIGPDRDVIGLVGFVNRAKRPDLVVAAVERLARAGRAVTVLVVGDDQSGGFLAEVLDRHPAVEVIVTGYQDAARFAAAVSTVDIVVSLRSPHFGESSAVLATAFAFARPVVAQRIGSSGELPADVVSFHPPGGDEAATLAALLSGLLDDPSERRRRGAAGRELARELLDREAVAADVLDKIIGTVTPVSGEAADTMVTVRPPVFVADDITVPTSPARHPGWLLGRDGTVHPLDGAPLFGSRRDADDPAERLVVHDGGGYTVVRRSGAESFGPGSVEGTNEATLAGDERLADRIDGPDGVVTLGADGFLYEAMRPLRRRHCGIAEPVGLTEIGRGVVVVGSDGSVVDTAGSPVDTGVGRVVGRVVTVIAGPDGSGRIMVTDAGRTYSIDGEASALGLAHTPGSPIVGGGWVPRG